MQGWLMDAYRKEDRIVLWVKTPEEDAFLEYPYRVSIHVKHSRKVAQLLRRHHINFYIENKSTYLRTPQKVCTIPLEDLHQEAFVRRLERLTNYRIPFYNADIPPEQRFLFEQDLLPFSTIDTDTLQAIEGPPPQLVKAILVLNTTDRHHTPAITRIQLNQQTFTGTEQEVLTRFAQAFQQLDPDVISMDYAYAKLPWLAERLQHHRIHCPLHRQDPLPLLYKGGRSFWTYGKVTYRDYAIRLHGRFLIDTSTMVGRECDAEAIMELATLTGIRFTSIASRSFGAAFQGALVRQLFLHDYLIPYKEKPVHAPMHLHDLLKSDRGGHTFDAAIGLHTDVAEIDFTSMFPWIIYNHNVSADTILTKEGPFAQVPGIPVKISHARKGLIPLTIKPLIDRRMHYKQHPTALNKERAVGLKWVLVTSYGYLRFREFKLGIASAHMAICAYARTIIVETARLAEQHGFRIVHGIVDSLYLQKKGITQAEVEQFCTEVFARTGIPITLEGIFKWIVFLPSVNEPRRPVPTRYYGALTNQDTKTRGIEIRQCSAPLIVKHFQHTIIGLMAQHDTAAGIVQDVPLYCHLLRKVVQDLDTLPKEFLLVKLVLSKDAYTTNIPQKALVEQLRKKNIDIHPGHSVSFIHQHNRPVLTEDYDGTPNHAVYRDLLIRSLFAILQPFGITRQDIRHLAARQTLLPLYFPEHEKLREQTQLLEKRIMTE